MDIYFNNNYGKLYEKVENGVAEVFEFSSEFGCIKHQFIKREIPIKINNERYFDIITPYGYGGPIVMHCNQDNVEKLVIDFYEKFKIYCEKNNIVSEFIRFHPILKNVKDFKNIYDVQNIRYTLGTTIKGVGDPIQFDFSKSCRKSIRQAINRGVSYRITESPTNIDNFKKVYYSTMDRNNADDYYYFDDDYFETCLNYFQDNILLVEIIYQEIVIAAGFYFVYEKFIHAHLSGTLTEFLNLSPAYVLKYATVEWAKKNNIEYIHYGGGTSNSIEDSLYKFKKKFAQNTQFEFYIGKKIWNTEIYNELVLKTNPNRSLNKQFFPLYRA